MEEEEIVAVVVVVINLIRNRIYLFQNNSSRKPYTEKKVSQRISIFESSAEILPCLLTVLHDLLYIRNQSQIPTIGRVLIMRKRHYPNEHKCLW